jgi:hypothetical protein
MNKIRQNLIVRGLAASTALTALVAVAGAGKKW